MSDQCIIDGRLSVVIPCYNSENSINDVICSNDEIFKRFGITDYEYILVNDHSKDNTGKVIRQIAESRNNVTAINLAKNCGQHSALMAGFHYVTGDYIVTCEDDGQTNMEAIGDMFAKLSEGYDVVSTYWEERGKRSIFRRAGSKMYNVVADRLLPNPEHVIVSIFFVARRYVIDEIIKYTQPYPYINGLLLRTTNNIASITCKQLPRTVGRSGYTFKKLLRLWLDSFTAFSIVPLRAASLFGVFTAFIGLIFAIVTVIRKLIYTDIAVGWSSLISVILVISGVILCVLGMIGEYLGRIYMCINLTPQFVIRDVISGEANAEKNTDS